MKHDGNIVERLLEWHRVQSTSGWKPKRTISNALFFAAAEIACIAGVIVCGAIAMSLLVWAALEIPVSLWKALRTAWKEKRTRAAIPEG